MRFGERIHDNTPVFRSDYNAHDKVLKNVKACSRLAVMRSMDRLLKDIGQRGVRPQLENETHNRSEIMRCHGFRKFFETNAFKAGMDNMYIRRLMGQKSGLEEWEINNQMGISACYVDSSSPEIWQTLKKEFNEQYSEGYVFEKLAYCRKHNVVLIHSCE
jgi:hypothetical protein